MTSQRFGDASWSNDADEHRRGGVCVMSWRMSCDHSGAMISVGWLLLQVLHSCSAACALVAASVPKAPQFLQQQFGQQMVFLVLNHPARRYNHV